ncbi:MAG: glycosyltransferase [Spirochaetes bacterium]|nr:glycosyltransferase [Spirochaetota bacterium]
MEKLKVSGMLNPKILHISSPGYRSAGKLAFDIHEEFMNQGYESFIISKDNNYGFPNSVSYFGSFWFNMEKILNRIRYKFRKLFKLKEDQDTKFGFHNKDHNNFQFQYRNILDKAPFKPDIVIFYALHEFINAKTMRMISEKTGAKIFWLFYDMGPMTGGCHHSWDCDRFSKECGKCPWLYSDNENDLSKKNLLFKKKYLKNTDIHFLVCSEWLMRKAKISSLLKGRPVHKWMMPIDLSEFKKTEKNGVKKELGLDKNKKYIFFGSVNLDNPRKGTGYLIEAVEMLFRSKKYGSDVELIIPGFGAEKIKINAGFNKIFPGFIYEREALIKYYQASDIVVIPSVEDTGPLMTSEAAACGTPVLAFETGSAFDIVFTGVTGYRAKLKDSEDLCKGLEYLLNLSETEYEQMSQNCVKIAGDKFEISGQVKKLIDIYQDKA